MLMIPVLFLITIIILHFISDFIFQTDYIAINKSTSWFVLFDHVTFYIFPFLLVFGWLYALVNFILHFATDAISSRVSSYFWKKDQRHWFFVTIGLDQAIHMLCLVMSYPLINLWWLWWIHL